MECKTKIENFLEATKIFTCFQYPSTNCIFCCCHGTTFGQRRWRFAAWTWRRTLGSLPFGCHFPLSCVPRKRACQTAGNQVSPKSNGFLCIDSMHFQSERQKAEEGSPRVWNQAGNELAVLNGLPVCECEFSFKSIRMLSFCQIYKSQNYIIYSFGQYDMHF